MPVALRYNYPRDVFWAGRQLKLEQIIIVTWEVWINAYQNNPQVVPSCWLGARAGSMPIVEMLMTDPGGTCYFDAQFNGRTILHEAALGGHLHMLEWLFQHPQYSSFLFPPFLFLWFYLFSFLFLFVVRFPSRRSFFASPSFFVSRSRLS